MKLLEGILKTLILLIVVGFVAYKFLYFFPVFPLGAPCSKPIPYTLGIFDDEFDITEKYFLNALLRAEEIWEKPYGKNLFAYEPENNSPNPLTINLIYDYRQEASHKLADLGITVDENKASYDALRAKFELQKKEYEKEKNAMNARVASFNAKSDTYEAEVRSWNEKGGAPEKEFNKLEEDRMALEEEAKALAAAQSRLNDKADEVNALVVAINRLASALNLTVETYNDINVARGESFEEGVYAEEGFKRQIDIYEFSTEEKLVRVLAHEFGHALKLDHVNDPKAIMYEFNQGNSISLAEADLDLLKLKCEAE